MALPLSNIPVVLFPLKLETRFVKDELWIRAFPDVPFLQGHDPRLTKEERRDARLFKQFSAEEQQRKAWEEMVGKYGVYRAAWIVRISGEELAQQEQDALENGEKAENEEPSFYFKWLPDRLVFYLYRKGDRTPAYKEEGPMINREGLTVLGEEDEWVQDFEEAVKAGMGIRIKLKRPEDTEFGRIIVSGIRYAEDPSVPAKGMADLFRNHQYTEGFSFLKYGTPTNNTEKAQSGHSAREEFDAAGSFDYAVKGLDQEPGTAGHYLAYSLGLETEDLKYVKNADLAEPSLSALFQKASWFALGAAPLFMLFDDQISSDTHEALWAHYARYVKTKGLYAALKIGDQPYGVLPVMNLRNALLDEDLQDGDPLFDKLSVLFARLLERWLEMVDNGDQPIPRLNGGGDSYTEMLKILSMQEHSSAYQIRAMEYNSFRKRLWQWLAKIPPSDGPALIGTSMVPPKELRRDLENVRKNITSLTGLLKELAGDPDRLLRAPLLSFSESNVNLIGFREGNSVITDVFGDPVLEEDGAEIQQASPFTLTQEDLSTFRDFLTHLQEKEDDELIQYTGELSVFTDLLWRSFINACQLYYREIAFDPDTEEVKGYPYLSTGDILKPAGAAMKRGEVVLEIRARRTASEAPSKTIAVKAPFDGMVEKMQVASGEEVVPGMPLFTLINETRYRKIRKQFIDLGQQIIAASEAVGDVKRRKEAQKEALREALDLNSYRLDAWITSLAARRIDEMRRRPGYEKGIYFGAYGWVEQLSKDNTHPIDESMTDIYREEGGIIHTPGPAQAVASAVFKNAFLSYREEQGGNPFALNLTSGRLQKGGVLLEGIRQGQEMEALLGYQLERYLHEHPDGGLHEEIYALRAAFPLYENTSIANGQSAGFVHLSVVDGLKAIQSKDNLPDTIGNKDVVKAYIEKLEDTLDAGLDTLFYEAGFQITQGNLSQAAAALDATKGEVDPPAIEALKTRIPGVGIAHRLAMVFPAPDERYPVENCRARLEPVLENWLAESLGDLNKIGCVVELFHAEEETPADTVSITLADLDIGYLDFLYMSQDPVSDGAGELELRIWKQVLQQKGELPPGIRYKITGIAPANCQPLVQALEVARYAYALISRCRPLKPEDLCLENEPVPEDREALDAIRDERIIPVFQRLKSLAGSDLTDKEALSFLARLDLENAKTALLGINPPDALKLKEAVETKVASVEALLSKYHSELPFSAAFELLRQIAATLFGPAFILLPPAFASDSFSSVIQVKKQQLLVGDKSADTNEQVWGQARIHNWVQGVAQIRENTEAFEDWLMVSEVWNQTLGRPNRYAYQIVQGPTLLQYPWVALSKDEIDTLLKDQYQPEAVYKNPVTGEAFPLPDGDYYPGGCESTVLYAPEGLVLEKAGKKIPVFGLLMESFSEHVPEEKVETGLSFHYNAPNNEPPQAILLAVHPKATMESDFFWSEDDLRDILYDTMDLFRIRLVDLEAIREYGYMLPLTYWLNVTR